MPDISRRSLAAGASLLVGAMALPVRAQQLATAVATPKFRVQPLTYTPEKITGLSAKLISSHHDEHYAGAVNRLNALSEQLAKLDFAETPASTIGELKREEHSTYNSPRRRTARRWEWSTSLAAYTWTPSIVPSGRRKPCCERWARVRVWCSST